MAASSYAATRLGGRGVEEAGPEAETNALALAGDDDARRQAGARMSGRRRRKVDEEQVVVEGNRSTHLNSGRSITLYYYSFLCSMFLHATGPTCSPSFFFFSRFSLLYFSVFRLKRPLILRTLLGSSSSTKKLLQASNKQGTKKQKYSTDDRNLLREK